MTEQRRGLLQETGALRNASQVRPGGVLGGRAGLEQRRRAKRVCNAGVSSTLLQASESHLAFV